MKTLGKSDIVFEILEGDSRLLPGWEINEMAFRGESADCEAEGGFLDDATLGMLTDEEKALIVRPGWYIMRGFRATYSKDYYGEVDADFEYDSFGPATDNDVRQTTMVTITDRIPLKTSENSSFAEVVYDIRHFLIEDAHEVRTERWQGVQANTDTFELFDANFRVDLRGIEDLDHWRKDISPSLPWADDHFLERVGGQPLNPGVQWRNWPWSQSANRHRKDEAFNHSYMERLWPKYARREPGGILPTDPLPGGVRRYPGGDRRGKYGIGWHYGDLEDLVDLLAHEPHTRQAWIPLFFPEDTGVADGGRKPCTLGYQILVREGRASIWYPLRSCDYVRHFRDDCYLAVRLLLWIIDRCREKNPEVWGPIRPGIYSMHMTSLHVFRSDMDQLKKDHFEANQGVQLT